MKLDAHKGFGRSGRVKVKGDPLQLSGNSASAVDLMSGSHCTQRSEIAGNDRKPWRMSQPPCSLEASACQEQSLGSSFTAQIYIMCAVSAGGRMTQSLCRSNPKCISLAESKPYQNLLAKDFGKYSSEIQAMSDFLGTPWTVAHQPPLSMGFSRQEYWSGLPCPPPGDLPDLGLNPHFFCLLHWQAGFLPLAPQVIPNTNSNLIRIIDICKALWDRQEL